MATLLISNFPSSSLGWWPNDRPYAVAARRFTNRSNGLITLLQGQRWAEGHVRHHLYLELEIECRAVIRERFGDAVGYVRGTCGARDGHMGHIRGRSHTVGMSLAGTVHLPVIICAFKKRPPLLASGSRSSVGGFPRGNGSARQPQQGSASANSSHVNVAFSYSGLLSPSACCDHFGQGAECRRRWGRETRRAGQQHLPIKFPPR